MENNFNNKKWDYKYFSLFDTVECPQCGNSITVNKTYKYHKCVYCPCHFEITTKNNKKKSIINIKEDDEWKKHWKNIKKNNNSKINSK